MNTYTWEDAAREFDLNEREITLAKALHKDPERIRAMRPVRSESWKDEPALFIRREFDTRLKKEKSPKTGQEWKGIKKDLKLDTKEVLMAEEMGLTPEEVKDLGKRAALLIRRKYDSYQGITKKGGKR